jgi:hypothetical protein
MPPTDTPSRGFSLADLATRWRVGQDKLRAWLAKGELVGVNVATNLAARPQWRISPEEVQRFERRRSSAPTPKPTRRRRPTHIHDYYPGAGEGGAE